MHRGSLGRGTYRPPIRITGPPRPPGPNFSIFKRVPRKSFVRIAFAFMYYINPSSKVIEPEGIEALCSDLEMNHADVRMLMLAWKMKAKKQGYFTLNEWQTGLTLLRVDDLRNLKHALTALEKGVWSPQDLRDFYSYAFDYCLTEDKQRTVDIESICIMLDLVLGSRFRAQVDSIVEYLKIQNDKKVLSKDQWMSIYIFCKEISFPDLGNYNPEDAWPVIIDDFIEWMKAKQS